MKPAAMPCRLEPQHVPRIWGRRRLYPLYETSEELPQPVGEVWLSGEDCPFADGPFAGRPLGEAWHLMPKQWKGERLAGAHGFPLLAKFLFPESTLSIQVHPGDAYAARHEAANGGRGKTELWYAVAAQPGAEVYLGLQPGTNQASLRRALADGSIETHLQRLPIAEGDAIFVPPGTVHTIGPGVVLCEIQEYSDLTYRLFDFGRTDAGGKPRELHVEKALDVIHFGQSVAGKTQPLMRRRGPVEVTYLATCSYFAVERWRLTGPADLPSPGDHFDLLVFLAGAGKVVSDDGRREYHPGEAWFVPANAAGFRLEPAAGTMLLRSYVPDLGTFERGLLREGVTRSEMAGFFFE